MKNNCLLIILIFIAIKTIPSQAVAQVTGKFGTYYDQRELLFESLPTSTSDIIFLGNSITDGAEWNEIFQNPHCKNRGISGDIIPGVLNRLETVTKGQPAKIFLMIGTNDMNWGYSNDSIASGVRAIVQRIKTESPKTNIIVQSILPTNDCYGLFTGHTKRWQDVAVINQKLKTMTEEEGVDYLDLYRHFANDEGKMDTLYSNDGLHLNDEGYKLWKNIVEEEIGRFPRPVFTSRTPLWLTLSTGSGLLRGIDVGASPMFYAGLGAYLNAGAVLELNRYRIQADLSGVVGFLLNIEGALSTDFNAEARGEFLYLCHRKNNLSLWAGGAGRLMFDLRNYSQLMNASMGMTGTADLQAAGMVQYDFSPNIDGEHNLFSIYGKLSLPVVARVLRPGFAYMDNYTSDLNTVGAILQDYQGYWMEFPGVSTDVGFMVNLLNNNKIGLSYRWDYFTTRKTGAYRFDRASHMFNVFFMFNIF